MARYQYSAGISPDRCRGLAVSRFLGHRAVDQARIARPVARLHMIVIVRKRKTGSPSRIEFKPLPSDDPRQRRPDISVARDKLGWTPTVELEEGLKKTIAYFRELLSMPAK